MSDKQFYVKIKGQKVPVTEEVYRAYVRPINARRRAEIRQNKCPIKGERSGLKRCTGKCSECPYYLKGNNRRGLVFSLNGLIEEGYEEAANLDIESSLIEAEEKSERAAALHKAISRLNERQKAIIRMVYFEGKSQEEVAIYYGVKKQAISNAMQRIYATLKKILEKN